MTAVCFTNHQKYYIGKTLLNKISLNINTMATYYYIVKNCIMINNINTGNNLKTR